MPSWGRVRSCGSMAALSCWPTTWLRMRRPITAEPGHRPSFVTQVMLTGSRIFGNLICGDLRRTFTTDSQPVATLRARRKGGDAMVDLLKRYLGPFRRQLALVIGLLFVQSIANLYL